MIGIAELIATEADGREIRLAGDAGDVWPGMTWPLEPGLWVTAPSGCRYVPRPELLAREGFSPESIAAAEEAYNAWQESRPKPEGVVEQVLSELGVPPQ